MANRMTTLAAATALFALATTPISAEAALALRAFGMPGLTPLGTVFDDDAGDEDGRAGFAGSTALGTGTGFTELQISALGAPFADNAILGGSVVVRTRVSGQVRVEVTQTDVAPGSAGLKSFFSFFFLLGLGSATMTSYISTSNIAFATDTQLATKTFSAVDDELVSTPIAVGGPYSQTIVFDISLAVDPLNTESTILVAASIGPEDAQPVPEPASLALLGAGLLGLGLARRRRRG